VRGAFLPGLLAAIHLYIAVRLLAPFGLELRVLGGLALAGLYALLIGATALIFGRRDEPRWLLWGGLVGTGFFSSLWVLTLLRDGVSLVGWLAAQFAAHPLLGPRWTRDSAIAVPALAALATLWGFVNARRRPAVREVRIPIAGLAPALDGFSILQISDLHVGPTIKRGFVQRVVDTANAQQPDLIALTGDLIDGRVPELAPHFAPLAGLRARHGVFAVTGNHEYYSGAHAWIAHWRALGFKPLMNEHVLLQHQGASLLLAGVPDYSAGAFDAAHRSDPARALHGAPPGLHPRVLLAHQPRTADAALKAGFDLQLSGHTHGGQFVPWNWFVPLQQPYVAGLHRHGAMWVYISRGTGYWGPPKRLGAPSEITLLRLVRGG
jgi:predicted MPP superfamily phosphohydrolase